MEQLIPELQFKPESEQFITATDEYVKIWNEEGEKIVQTLQEISGLNFKQTKIEVIVYEGISDSGIKSRPMKLRASYPSDVKKATVVHELGHRLLGGNGLAQFEDDVRPLEGHKQLFLFLYDVWTQLYGEEFAKKNVEIESGRQAFYKEAWDWALAFDKDERKAELKKLLANVQGK